MKKILIVGSGIRLPHLIQAMKEVELIEKGKLPKKTGREFLKELREGK